MTWDEITTAFRHIREVMAELDRIGVHGDRGPRPDGTTIGQGSSPSDFNADQVSDYPGSKCSPAAS